MADDELQALRRQVDATPDDLALAREYERRLLRAGRVDEVRARLEARLLCEVPWDEHEDDGRWPGVVRHCPRCVATVTRVRDAAELRRYVAAGRSVAGGRAQLDELLDGVVARLRDGESERWSGRFTLVETAPQDPPTGEALLSCGCLGRDRQPRTTRLHEELQDTECDAWKRLLALIEAAAADGRREFAPLEGLSMEDRARIVTLPPTIAKLKRVRSFHAYGSHLSAVPPEIGEMTDLRTFVPYTSYRLHWFPYEITRCKALKDSTVSTRALYGNFKHRPPFPDLTEQRGPTPRACSVCDRPASSYRQVWLSLRVATDVLPLLVNACSADCIDALPTPAEGYEPRPHRGGPGPRRP